MYYVLIVWVIDDVYNYVCCVINEVNLILIENCILGEWLVRVVFKSDSE